jgi:membrane protease YdiL (CAAX protease family)
MGYELSLFAYVWLLGLRPRGVRICEIIGGKWQCFADFLVDLKTALLFWLIVVAVLAVVQYLVRYNGIKAARPLLPQGGTEITMFIVLSVTAGFCEEFIFRGYLQRQFLALANRAWIAIVLQALVFGVAHLYQGMSAVIAITVYGGLFGILAWRRNSLRPGMMQHAAQDSFSGIAASILIKHRII